MTTATQNVAAGLGLSLILANALNGPQRSALRGFVTGPPTSGGGGGGGPDPFFKFDPFIPNIPGVPQGPLSGIPFSPISGTTSISPFQALVEVAGEFVFVAILVLLAEDYTAAVVLFLTILWLVFLMSRTAHPWRSQRLAAAAAPSSLREA